MHSNQMNLEYSLSGYLPEIFRDAAFDVINQTKAPPGLVVSSLLAGASGVCQSLVDVKYRPDHGTPSPCSLYIMVIAASGERKTTVDSLITRPILKIDKAREKDLNSQKAKTKAQKDVWSVKIQHIKSQIKNALLDDNEELVQSLGMDLERLHQEVPKTITRRILFQNITIQKLAQELSGENSFGLQMSAEAGGILANESIQGQSFYSSLWDSGDYIHDRMASPSFRLHSTRFSCSLMLQPRVLQAFMEKRGELSRGSGRLARFLVCEPESTQGQRFLNDTTGEATIAGLKKFHDRMDELLKLSLHNDGKSREILYLDQEAQSLWMNFYNDTESTLTTTGALYEYRDMGSKLPENVARISAVLHTFSGHTGPIDAKTMKSAINIAIYYRDQFIRVFKVPDEKSKEESAANKLEQFFNYKYPMGSNPSQPLTLRQVTQYGPVRYNKNLLISALSILHNRGVIHCLPRNNSLIIHVNTSMDNRLNSRPLFFTEIKLLP